MALVSVGLLNAGCLLQFGSIHSLDLMSIIFSFLCSEQYMALVSVGLLKTGCLLQFGSTHF
jgi:hypothetical protein